MQSNTNTTINTNTKTFHGLGIAPGLLEVIQKLGYVTPTPIQEQAIPIAVTGKDVVGVAQTGTGKTLAFGIPMIQRLFQMKEGGGLVVLPTRELALQAEEVIRRLGAGLGLRTAVLIGGMAIGPQIKALSRRPHVIIGTPGRINDHLQQRTFSLATTTIVVLDEADRMLDMGFAPQIQKIFQHLPKVRQTMLISATMPPEIMKLATAYLQIPIRVEIAPAGTTAERVTQEVFIVPKVAKTQLLEKLLQGTQSSTLVFTRTKYGAKRLTRTIYTMGHTVAEIHSNRSLAQRREALEGFKTGKYRVLVATDIAARGIDVVGIELVVNYDLPGTAEDYVHRIGRTARGGAEGHAVSFAMPEERYEIRNIERLIRQTLPVSQLPELPKARQFESPMRQENFPRPPFRGGSSYGSSRGPQAPGPQTSGPRTRRPFSYRGGPRRQGRGR